MFSPETKYFGTANLIKILIELLKYSFIDKIKDIISPPNAY